MKKKSLFIALAGAVLLFLPGCAGQSSPGLLDTVFGFFSPDPVYWTDPQGRAREVVFTTGQGSDLYDAYKVCDKNWECYQAYVKSNQETYKKRPGRGQIRLYSQGSGSRVFAEHYMDRRTDEVLAPFCFLNLQFNPEGEITEAEYTK